MILVHEGISGWKEIPGAALKLTAEITISTVLKWLLVLRLE